MKNKGQGLTLDTIVIAALVVIVLVVLILIFTGNLGPFSKSASGCTERGGQCLDACGTGQIKLTLATGCTETGKTVCCISAPEPVTTTTK